MQLKPYTLRMLLNERLILQQKLNLLEAQAQDIDDTLSQSMFGKDFKDLTPEESKTVIAKWYIEAE